MYLRAIHLTRFCGFKDFEMQFANGTILIGPNHGGKTTILRAIKLLFTVLQSPNYVNQFRHTSSQYLAASKEYTNSIQSVQTQSGLITTLKDQIIREAKARFDQQRHVLKAQLQAQPVDITGLARSYGLADSSSFVFGHDVKARSAIEVTIDIDGTELHVVANLSQNHLVLVVRIDGASVLDELDLQKTAIMEKLFKLQVEFIPPITSALIPSEKALPWPEIQQRIDNGRDFEVWRNRIHWLSEGKSLQRYQKVVDRVRASLSAVNLHPPARTKDPQPNVILTYEEDGTSYDVSESGAGFRTLLGLAAAIELSDAHILLLMNLIPIFMHRSNGRSPSSS